MSLHAMLPDRYENSEDMLPLLSKWMIHLFWWWITQVPLKRQKISTRQHDVKWQ